MSTVHYGAVSNILDSLPDFSFLSGCLCALIGLRATCVLALGQGARLESQMRRGIPVRDMLSNYYYYATT